MRRSWLIAGALGLAVLGGVVYSQLGGGSGGGSSGQGNPAPVEVAPVEHGPIELRRTFSGTLESPAEFVVAPRIAGRVVRLQVDVSDTVKRNQIVAELDNEEYQQTVAQSRAELALANANLTEARNNYLISGRESERVSQLHEKGLVSDSQHDAAKAKELSDQAAVAVAEAQVTRAEAALAAARIRLGYTRVPASWPGGDDLRVVAERYVNEGDTVAANARLLSIIELDPIHAVLFVTEKDYGRLRPGQAVNFTTDAYPGRTFEGTITRIAPVFRQASRQARVELSAANPRHELKPGMFVRAEIVLEEVDNATIVPVAALTTRDNVTGVFVVNEDGKTVSWRRVEEGIRQDQRVQVKGEGVEGRVVTLGQQLIDHGSTIVIPGAQPENRKEASTK